MSESDEEFDAQSLKRWKDRFEKKKTGTRARKAKKNDACTVKQTGVSAGRAEIKGEILMHVHAYRRNLSPHKQHPDLDDNVDTRRSLQSDSLLVSCPDPLYETDSHHFLSMDSPVLNFEVNSVRSYFSGSEDHSESNEFVRTRDDAELSIVSAADSAASNQESIRGLSMSGPEPVDKGGDFKAAGPNSLVDDDCVSTGLASFSEELLPAETCTFSSNRTEFKSQEHSEDSLEQEWVPGTSDHGTATCRVSDIQSKVMSSDEAACFHGDTEASSSRTSEDAINFENFITGSDVEIDCESTEFGRVVNGISQPWPLTNPVSDIRCGTVPNAPQVAHIPAAGHSKTFSQEEACAAVKAGNSTLLAPTQATYSAVKRKSSGVVPSPVKRQTTLLHFLSSSSEKREAGKDRRTLPSSAASRTPASTSLPASLPNAFAVPTWKPASSGSSSRSCPFYKRVPGTCICLLLPICLTT